MRLILFIIALSSFIACGPELPNSAELVADMLNEKTLAYQARKNLECRADALEDAEAHVDSIVHRLLNLDLVDTLNFPSKPLRPSSPEHIIGTVKRFELKEEG